MRYDWSMMSCTVIRLCVTYCLLNLQSVYVYKYIGDICDKKKLIVREKIHILQNKWFFLKTINTKL